MFGAGIVMAIFGVVIFWVGWELNTNTPVQTPLPIVGAGLVGLGLGLVLWFHP